MCTACITFWNVCVHLRLIQRWKCHILVWCEIFFLFKEEKLWWQDFFFSVKSETLFLCSVGMRWNMLIFFIKGDSWHEERKTALRKMFNLRENVNWFKGAHSSASERESIINIACDIVSSSKFIQLPVGNTTASHRIHWNNHSGDFTMHMSLLAFSIYLNSPREQITMSSHTYLKSMEVPQTVHLRFSRNGKRCWQAPDETLRWIGLKGRCESMTDLKAANHQGKC